MQRLFAEGCLSTNKWQ